MSSYNLRLFLKEVIEQQGISISDLSRRTALSRECIYKLLRGEVQQPELSTIVRLAKALKTHPLLLLRKLFEGWEFRNAVQPSSERANDAVGFVGDVTCPDNFIVSVNTKFTKVWEIQNTGQQPWKNRRLVCVDDQLEVYMKPSYPASKEDPFRTPSRQRCLIPSQTEIPVPDACPGESIQLSVDFTAPPFPCSTISYWKMVDENGAFCFPEHEGLSCLAQVVAL